jgi:uncharacterized Zn finger protein
MTKDYNVYCPDCLEDGKKVILDNIFWGGDGGPPEYRCPNCGEVFN